jgi:hypothetical protein
MSTDAQRALAAHLAQQQHAHQQATLLVAPPPRQHISKPVFSERMEADRPRGEHPETRQSGELRGTLAKVASEVQDRLEKIRGNPTINPFAAEIQAAEHAEKILNSNLEKIDEVSQSLQRQLGHMQREAESLMVPEDPHTRSLLPEARATLLSMPAAQRDKLLQDRQHADYPLLMHAVASAPAWMSGADEGQRITVRNTILGLRRPALLSRPAEYQRELEYLAKAREGFIRTFNELVDFKSAAAMRGLAGGEQ